MYSKSLCHQQRSCFSAGQTLTGLEQKLQNPDELHAPPNGNPHTNGTLDCEMHGTCASSTDYDLTVIRPIHWCHTNATLTSLAVKWDFALWFAKSVSATAGAAMGKPNQQMGRTPPNLCHLSIHAVEVKTTVVIELILRISKLVIAVLKSLHFSTWHQLFTAVGGRVLGPLSHAALTP